MTPHPSYPHVLTTLFCAGLIAALMPAAVVADDDLPAAPQDPEPGFTAQEADEALKQVKEQIEQRYERHKQRYADRDDVKVHKGMLVDRKEKRITLDGAALAHGPQTPMEFFVTPFGSAKDHEAIALVFVKPSKVREALIFLGMEPGKPIDWDDLRFWPRGERVVMHFEWEEPAADNGEAQKRRVRAEDLIYDRRIEDTMPRNGLVFTGSFFLDDDHRLMQHADAEEGERVLAADIASAESIASIYNEPSTVLDVPRQAGQSEVYQSYTPNPQYRFRLYQPVTITIEPEPRPDGKPRVRDMQLDVAVREGEDGKRLGELELTLTDDEGNRINQERTLAGMVRTFNEAFEAKQDPFVSVRIDKDVPLHTIRTLYELLDGQLQGEEGIRLTRQPEGQLYYQAFLPDERMKDREEVFQPGPELHLQRRGENIEAELVDVQKDWAVTPPTLSVEKHEVEGPEHTPKLLEELEVPTRRHVLIFAPHDMTHGELLEWALPVQKSHEIIFIFLNGRED